MLRRLEKRILVPLPNQEARAHMFQSLLSDRCAEGMDWCDLAKRTEGYSGEMGMSVCVCAHVCAYVPVYTSRTYLCVRVWTGVTRHIK